MHYIKNNHIQLLFDIHGASADRDFDIEFGTLNGLTIDSEALCALKSCFQIKGINNIKVNDPFLGGGVTQYIYANTDIDIVQIEINAKFRDYNNFENIKKICDSLIAFIDNYK